MMMRSPTSPLAGNSARAFFFGASRRHKASRTRCFFPLLVALAVCGLLWRLGGARALVERLPTSRLPVLELQLASDDEFSIRARSKILEAKRKDRPSGGRIVGELLPPADSSDDGSSRRRVEVPEPSPILAPVLDAAPSGEPSVPNPPSDSYGVNAANHVLDKADSGLENKDSEPVRPPPELLPPGKGKPDGSNGNDDAKASANDGQAEVAPVAQSVPDPSSNVVAPKSDDEDASDHLPLVEAPKPFAVNGSQVRSTGRFSQFAIALKSGADTAADRVPIQFLTFLRDVDNVIIIGEAPNVYLGEEPVVDVYTGVQARAQRNLRLLELQKNKKAEEEQKERADERGPEWFKDTENADSSNVHLADKSLAPAGAGDDSASSDDSLPRRRRRRGLDQIQNVENSMGWRLDAYKNLPGFQLLYNKFPKADWYLMLDDDTYLFMDNLDQFLKSMDPSQPHYIGNANVFVGCDGVKAFGQGPSFAHGGSGIVISQGAMQVLMTGVEECVIKYRTCWAGDIRVALCFRDLGILLKGAQGFWRDPPNKDFRFPDDPCMQPKTFHHLVPSQIQKLYEAELLALSAHPLKGVTASDVYNYLYKTSGPVKDYDRSGHEIGTTQIEAGDDAPKKCERVCREKDGCRAWVLDLKSTCWLKSKAEASYESIGMWTGTVANDNYKC